MADKAYLEKIIREQETKFAGEAALYEDAGRELKKAFDAAIALSDNSKIKESYQKALAVQSDIKTLEREVSRHTDGIHIFAAVRRLLQKYSSSVSSVVQYIETTIDEQGIQLDSGFCRSRRTI